MATTDGTAESLVSPAWVRARLGRIVDTDPAYRLLEVDLDPDRYDEAHIPGAVGVDWTTAFQTPDSRDVPPPAAFAERLGSWGITDDTTVVVYGDSSNWLAAYAFWLLRYYGHADVRLLDGGRRYWTEYEYVTTNEPVDPPSETYTPGVRDESLRAYREGVERALETETTLIDARHPDEYHGVLTAPPGMTESAVRGGHIPGARNVVWSANTRPDGRFKPIDTLCSLYAEQGISSSDEVITYCRIGERSAVTWFVLTQLLGYDAVRNYDGSWTEWGNMIGSPIECGT